MIAEHTPPTSASYDAGDEITLTRLERQHKARRTAFWHIASGELISDHGDGANIGADAKLSTVLDIFAGMSPSIRPRTLYLMGGESAENTPRRSWWAEPASRGERSWQYDGYELAAHAATGGALDATNNAGQYERDGVRVDVRMSALWFPGLTGAGEARRARDAWNTLNQLLRRRFDDHATLLATPAATGRDLLHRSLPRGVRYPLAPSAFRDLLYEISSQGRFEFCPAPEMQGRTIDGLYTLDARWMYAACVRGLPTGTPEHRSYPHGADALEAFAGYTPAWYRVNIRVPQEWRHTGLIAQRVNGESVYPCEPGMWIRDVWVAGAELAVALQHGWPCLIYERWAYEPAEGHRPLADPTRAWIQTLREMRVDYAGDAPVASAIRHLVLDTVGGWHTRAGRKLRITPIRDYPGAASGAQLHHIDRRAGLAHWYEPKPLAKDALPWQRPEWSSTVWTRSRARVNAAALRIHRAELVAYRADGLVTCAEPDAALWIDDGQPGTFRRKPESDVRGPLVMPADVNAMQELRRAAAKGAR